MQAKSICISTYDGIKGGSALVHCKNWSITLIPNYHWNHTKFEFGMIPVAIWYKYYTSVFAVYNAGYIM